MELIIKFICTLIVVPIIRLILIVTGIIGLIQICRAAACIINEHERAFGKVRWKWLIFIDKNKEVYTDAEAELNEIEKELESKSRE